MGQKNINIKKMEIKIENIFIRADAVTSIYIMRSRESQQRRGEASFFFLFYNGFSEAKSNYRQAALFLGEIFNFQLSFCGDIDLALFIDITLYILYRVTRFGRTITIMASVL